MTIYKEQLLLDYLGCNPDAGEPAREWRTFIDGVDGPKTQAARERFRVKYGVQCNGDNLIAAVSGSIGKAASQTVNQSTIPENSAASNTDAGAYILERLRKEGFTEAACFGILGNLMCESRLNPKNLEDQFEKRLGYSDESYTLAVDTGAYTGFVGDSAGYGIAQWTYYTRKRALLAYAKECGKSVGSIEVQTEYLLTELRRDYPKLYRTLKTTQSIREASDAIMTEFERPADVSTVAKNTRYNASLQMQEKYK